jgi:hypothetical protein
MEAGLSVALTALCSIEGSVGLQPGSGRASVGVTLTDWDEFVTVNLKTIPTKNKNHEPLKPRVKSEQK